MNLLQMSFSGAAFITAVVLIRAVAINKLPKKTFLVLWELVILRLLIPFSIPSMFSIYTLVTHSISSTTLPEAGTDYNIPTMQGLFVTTQGVEQPPVDISSSVSMWFIVWCAGIIIITLFFVISYLRCLIEFRTALPVHHHYVEKWLAKRPSKRPILVKQSDRISAPLTYGIFRPVILMPKKMDWKNEKQLQYVLSHEYVHIYRYDTVTKLIATLALCIHWFNPFVWVMYILFNRDIELACDESVIRQFGEKSKSAYSLMLISMEATKSGLLPFCNSFSKNAIEERITAIMKTKKITIFSLVLACLIVAGTATAFATSAQAGNNRLSLEEHDRRLNAEVEKTYQEETMLSYVDTQDGKTYYSMDGGATFEPLTDEEYEKRFPTPDVEWWTYEEYKAWLEEQKIQLQSMIGERGWTGGRGEFVWTQEIVDETIAMYEETLQDIKNGIRISKSVDGDTDIQMAFNPEDIELGTSEKAISLSILLSNGEEVTFGPYENVEELLSEVKPFCSEQVKLGNMKQSEADEILSKYAGK